MKPDPGEIVREALMSIRAEFPGDDIDDALAALATMREQIAREGAELKASRFAEREWRWRAYDMERERDEAHAALREIRDGPEWRHGHPVDIARAALVEPSEPGQITAWKRGARGEPSEMLAPTPEQKAAYLRQQSGPTTAYDQMDDVGEPSE